MIRPCLPLALGAALALSGCFGLECLLPGVCSDFPDEAEGEGEGEADVRLCDEDGACFVCGVEAELIIEPNGSGCDGLIVCDDVEFRVLCALDNGFDEFCECQVDREAQRSFGPTELCEAANVTSRALDACGWTLE